MWYQRLWIFDFVRLHDYTPPAQISALASDDTMTPLGKHLFYVYHPVLEGSAQFNKDCTVSEQAITLGCTAIGKGIYLYDVRDPDLDGVEQVTAAHEMLHVAYSRLSPSELAKVNTMVWNAYISISATDPTLASEEQLYDKTEGSSAVLNELHSVLGTEIANLPPALEAYYSKYFTNRQAIVSFANDYRNEFTSREQIVSQDDAQLSTWKQQITSNETSLMAQLQQLNQSQSQLNVDKNGGEINAYNSAVDGYNNAVNTYNDLINQTKQLINSYNSLVSQRNDVAQTVDQLTQSLSSLPSNLSTQ